MNAPLVGDGSIFGNRPGAQGVHTETSRTMRGFSPAPGFRFDVHLELRAAGRFVVVFSQPDRRAPYLEGDLAWTITDDDGGAVFEEQINTEQALAAGGRPLGGSRPSLRRWLFFRAGHGRVMLGAANRLAALAAPPVG